MKFTFGRSIGKYCQLSIVNYQLSIICALCIVLVGCSGPRTIPDKELEVIITDILLTEGVRSSGMKIDADVPVDSIDFYSPVLDDYDYTIVDFRHTINVLASRKSNPLEGVMAHVMETIDHQAALAQHRYDIARRFDSLALKAFSDTLYFSDTTIVGSLKKFSIRLDSIKPGDYRITMGHQSMLDYRVPQKSLKYYFGKKSEKNHDEKTLWFNRSDEFHVFDEVVTTAEHCDSLIIYFSDAAVNRYKDKKEAPIKDTSFVEDIAVVYTPPLNETRRRYHNRYFGQNALFLSDLHNNNEQHKKDSLPGPIGRIR